MKTLKLIVILIKKERKEQMSSAQHDAGMNERKCGTLYPALDGAAFAGNLEISAFSNTAYHLLMWTGHGGKYKTV